MSIWNRPLSEWGNYEAVQQHIREKSGTIQITGCMDAAKSYLMSGIDAEKKRLVVTFHEQKAKELLEDFKVFDEDVYYYPAKDVLFYQADIRGNLLTSERLSVLKAMREKEHYTVVTTVDALLDRLMPPEELYRAVLTFRVGETAPLAEITKKLVSMGYEKNYQVEGVGDFAVRGGILDIFPLSEDAPIRIEFWGDDIDSIRSFDVESQRSMEHMEEAVVYPATELILTKARMETGLLKIKKEAAMREKKFRETMNTEEAFRLRSMVDALVEGVENGTDMASAGSFLTYFCEDTVTFLDYFENENTIIYIDEPARDLEAANAVELEFSESMKSRLVKGYVLSGQTDVLVPVRKMMAGLRKFPVIALSTLDQKCEAFKPSAMYAMTTRSINSYNKSFELLIKDLRHYKKAGYQLVLMSGSKSRAMRLAKDLQEEGLAVFYTEDRTKEPQKGEIMVCYGKLKRGFELSMLSFAMITESDIFGQERRKKKRKKYEGERIRDFAELKIGDYVVHENHGLGIYRGIEKVDVEGVTKDYIKIEYDKGGALYMQANNLELLQKYAGADAKKPKLNKLGSQDWNKTKAKVRGAVTDIARELVELYAARENMEGYQFSPDTVWQREFEELFLYEETDDQLLAIEAAKRDMESKKTMDRLICGDVGFGKTEIAIRAAFKAVQDSKQVVYLVPTTILAQQHYNTFVQRMKDFPVNIGLLSRFSTPAQQKKVIAGLKKGEVDIVIGTHRLLSKDVDYKDLGLLIIDEEQRFGVAHKEKIKQLKNQIDVLTLTATPIPRTLHMSLVGIRDMSVLEEAPVDRMPIQTYVLEQNEEMVKEAIRRELGRGGQVYYVYNRVKQIAEVTDRIRALVPEANVAYAHGQMKERELEDIMYQFVNGELDVLVTTTIIETGLDISNANTMIIQDADNMGLSQLYQLRGRVGRSNRTSYAFLMYRRDKLLKEVAEKRLHAIREFTDLGSGIKIAMKDLEIRGAGNILGADQHGHMEAVGYDLYCKMLNEAVKLMKGLPVKESFATSIDLSVNAFIPPSYIPNEFQKLDMYKRIGNIETQEDKEEILEEFIDRFGDPPKAVLLLLQIALLKARAHSLDITEISQKQETITIKLYEKARISPAGFAQFIASFEGAMNFVNKKQPPYFVYRRDFNNRTKQEDVMVCVEHILDKFVEYLLDSE
ncbi:transcription-repair coupling factor (superfamily II helicase) [Lachnospiraceae bacterium XBB1006]|nr:transcription-repair coupling factor (superfamily II helicase) [Lachnospiraceae bacterium XBB1006]